MHDFDTKLALLEQRMTAMETQQKEAWARLEKSIGRLGDKMEELTGIMNRGKGALAASMALAGMIGAGILAVINYFTKILPGHH